MLLRQTLFCLSICRRIAGALTRVVSIRRVGLDELAVGLKILFLTHYYPPEVNAPATRTFEHCVRWARAGHDVTGVRCAPNCRDGVVWEGYRNRLRRQVVMVDGVRVVRGWTYLAKNSGTVRRIANYLSYMFSAILACLRLPRPDVVIATSPQFFCGWAGVFVSRLKLCPSVLDLLDILPESIRAVVPMHNAFLLRSLEFLARRLHPPADIHTAIFPRTPLLSLWPGGSARQPLGASLGLWAVGPRRQGGKLLGLPFITNAAGRRRG